MNGQNIMTDNSSSRLNLAHDNSRGSSIEFSRGVEHLNEKSIPEAVDRLQQAYESVGRSSVYHNKYASYCGLARVLSGDSSGIQLCRDAAKSEINDGDVFLNLARAELFLKHRKSAVIALKKGLQIEPRHLELRAMREELGVRRRSPMPFLPRSHPLNHAVGKLLRK